MVKKITLGEKIRQLREKSKITQTQLAEYLCVDQSLISKLEGNDRSPSIELLEKLTILFGCAEDYFETDHECHSSLQFAFRANELNNADFEAISAINRIALNLREMKKMLGGEET